jgi:hypothetical protein
VDVAALALDPAIWLPALYVLVLLVVVGAWLWDQRR